MGSADSWPTASLRTPPPLQSRISCLWVFLKGADCFEICPKTSQLRMLTLNCRRAACAISCAPCNFAIFAARPGWRKGLRVATNPRLISKDLQYLYNERKYYESCLILRWFRHAYARIFRTCTQADGSDRISSHPLA